MEMEEDQSISRPKEISDESLNPISQKHAAMLQRLSNLHQSRLQESISRKTDNSSPLESTKSFLDRFSEAKRSIQDDLDRCRLVSDPESKARLKSDLEKVSVSIAEIEKLVSENSYFLPSYEIRSSLKTISELKESLENANSKLLPKKKFAFKNKATKRDQNNATSTAEVRASETILPEKLNIQIRDSPGFKNRENAVLVKHFRSSEEGDFTLSDLNCCEVRLTGSLRALFIHRLRSCRIFVGPVLGSILIEEVEGCLFMLASHQIRIHHARNTDFYLRVRSRPIIEDSSSVRFAPYHLSYEGLDKDLQDSGLDGEYGNWANVDDFRWLRAVQSPNWSILPDDERVSIVNISNADTCSEDS
ncbi:tubulin-folding cofactor C-like [Telopea speciosissima]|uniref:tubulin-folding cofactor C-like n=1 Tax=Telopea speciosissima TaxID=54955 RepID=UPI001CC4D2F0|nr:tubulin-folding cofactor C-like [Telopea speciosissima]